MEQISSSDKVKDGKGAQQKPKRSLEQLRQDNGLHVSDEKIEPDLLTGKGMVHSTRFRENLQRREARNRFQRAFSRSSNTRLTYAREMHQDIINRCEQLCQIQAKEKHIVSFVSQLTDQARSNSKAAYDRIQNNTTKEGHQTREKACEVLCIESDRLEMLHLKLESKTKIRLDPKLLEAAHDAFEKDLSKNPPELNYRAAIMIKDDAEIRLIQMCQYLSDNAQNRVVSEFIRKKSDEFIQNAEKWYGSIKWISAMIYPGERNSIEFTDNWFKDKCGDFVNAAKGWRAIDEDMVDTFKGIPEQTAPTTSQDIETSHGPIPGISREDHQALNDFYRKNHPDNPFKD